MYFTDSTEILRIRVYLLRFLGLVISLCMSDRCLGAFKERPEKILLQPNRDECVDYNGRVSIACKFFTLCYILKGDYVIVLPRRLEFSCYSLSTARIAAIGFTFQLGTMYQ